MGENGGVMMSIARDANVDERESVFVKNHALI